MNKADFNRWTEVCELIAKRCGRVVPECDIPVRYKDLLDFEKNEARELAKKPWTPRPRRTVGLIVFFAGYGWKLREGWKDRLAVLEKGVEKEVEA